MPETELSRALHDLTPEPPRTLYADELLRLARRRRTTRVALLSCVPVAAVAVVAVAVHGSGPSASVAIAQPTPTATAESPVPAPSEPAPVTTTRARADVDGDGRIDEVTVSSATGVVTLALAGGPTLQAKFPFPDSSNKLQAVADLFGTGTRQILVYSSASGCCADHPNDSASLVLTLVGQRLELVRDAGSQPLRLTFDVGRGDVYAGIQCRRASHDVVQTSYLLLGPGVAERSRSTITLSGATATVSAPVKTRASAPQDPASFAVARDCPGLAGDGTGSR